MDNENPIDLISDEKLDELLNASPAERVTPEYMRSRISEVTYARFTPTVTLCNITIDNGYSVRGESACVNPENYNQQIGERIAYDSAFDKLWPLFGFLLAEKKAMADELDKEELLEHTAEAGEAAKSRVEELLEQLSVTMAGVAQNTSKMAEHLATLQIQKAAEDVPATAREGVNDAIDTAGAAGDVGAKAVDVPLAASEDVIHDTAETATQAQKDVEKTRRIFKKKRRG